MMLIGGWLFTALLQLIAMLYILRLLRHPFRYPGWIMGWVGFFALGALLTIRRIHWAALYPTLARMNEWEDLLLTLAISFSYTLGAVCIAAAFPKRLPIRSLVPAKISIDSQSRILAWNAEAEHLLGWPASEAVGQDLADLVIPRAARERHRYGVAKFLAERHSGAVLHNPYLAYAQPRRGPEMPVLVQMTAEEMGDDCVFHANVYRLVVAGD